MSQLGSWVDFGLKIEYLFVRVNWCSAFLSVSVCLGLFPLSVCLCLRLSVSLYLCLSFSLSGVAASYYNPRSNSPSLPLCEVLELGFSGYEAIMLDLGFRVWGLGIRD